MSTVVKKYDSPEEYADYLVSIPTFYHISEDMCGRGWGGISYKEGINRLNYGDTSRLEQAKAILNELDVEGLISNSMPILQSSIAGFVPNVPNAISGHPESMFSRGYIESPNLTTPINVYVETTVSSGVTIEQLITRGVATLAFVLAMEVIRPVELYIIQVIDHAKRPGVYAHSVKIASRPMDLGRAVWMLTDPCIARRFMFAATNHYAKVEDQTPMGPWAFNSSPTDDKYVNKVRELFDMQPEDVYLKGGYLFDNLMLTNPVQWVKNMIAKHRGDVNED